MGFRKKNLNQMGFKIILKVIFIIIYKYDKRLYYTCMNPLCCIIIIVALPVDLNIEFITILMKFYNSLRC